MSLSSEGESSPRSFPVPTAVDMLKRRAVFSKSATSLASHHVRPSAYSANNARTTRRTLRDESLRLIDDLTNRPVDPLFFDARLVPRRRSAFAIWSTRVVVFLICIAVGFSGSLFVQQLQADPRKEVRRTLAAELEQQNSNADSLSNDVNELRKQVDRESQIINEGQGNTTATLDDLANGFSEVTGEGISLSLANPLAAGGDAAEHSLSGNTSGSSIRVITDTDLQVFMSLLWQSGAEAISVNGHRIGVQTSVRTAGNIILVGVHQIESPYTIEAIGPSDALATGLGTKRLPDLYKSFHQAGIYPQVTRTKSITLEAADSVDVSNAKVRD